MKKLLIVLISTMLATTSVYATQKNKPAAQKKVVKKHQRVDGTKVADDKPTAPVKKKK